MYDRGASMGSLLVGVEGDSQSLPRRLTFEQVKTWFTHTSWVGWAHRWDGIDKNKINKNKNKTNKNKNKQK